MSWPSETVVAGELNTTADVGNLKPAEDRGPASYVMSSAITPREVLHFLQHSCRPGETLSRQGPPHLLRPMAQNAERP